MRIHCPGLPPSANTEKAPPRKSAPLPGGGDLLSLTGHPDVSGPDTPFMGEGSYSATVFFDVIHNPIVCIRIHVQDAVWNGQPRRAMTSAEAEMIDILYDFPSWEFPQL